MAEAGRAGGGQQEVEREMRATAETQPRRGLVLMTKQLGF